MLRSIDDSSTNGLDEALLNVVAFGRERKRATTPSARLRGLLRGGEVNLAYQPQFDLASGEVRGVEALLRVRALNGDGLNPAELITAAEHDGLISILGQAISVRALSDFAAMRSVGCALGRVAINVSPLELRDAQFCERFLQFVQAANLTTADVELEITESWSLRDPSLDLKQLNALADMGVSIALDDFGAGHANWVNAVNLPITTLKIDRALVAEIATDDLASAAVRSICRACNDMDIDVLAEGVGNRDQRAMLLDMGCKSGQGFALAMPLPPEEVMDVERLPAT